MAGYLLANRGTRSKIIAFIEDEEVVEENLKHLGLWKMKARPPPKVTTLSSDSSAWFR
jgi:hypothetical protein